MRENQLPLRMRISEAHLLFQPAGRLSGSDGCNRFTGTCSSWEIRSRSGRWLGPDGVHQRDRRNRTCVPRGAEKHNAIDGRQRPPGPLRHGGQSGRGVYSLVVKRPGRRPHQSSAGTSWQLVKFQGSDEKSLTPDGGAKYTIEFGSGGRLTARIDCNRGPGTWKSNGPNQLQFGPLALTRAKCPDQSMHDQIVKQWANIRSYIGEGRPSFSLADGRWRHLRVRTDQEERSDHVKDSLHAYQISKRRHEDWLRMEDVLNQAGDLSGKLVVKVSRGSARLHIPGQATRRREPAMWRACRAPGRFPCPFIELPARCSAGCS